METHRIDVPEDLGGGWVEIKARRSLAELRAIESTAARVGGAAGQRGIELDILAYDVTKARTCIVAWSFTDDDGNALPPERIGELDDDVGEWVLDAIDRYYASRRRSKSVAPAAAAGA